MTAPTSGINALIDLAADFGLTPEAIGLTPAVFSGSRSTSGRRRSKADITALKSTLFTLIREDRPMTVRQVFYRLVSMGAIGKSEAEYKGTVVRLLTKMRLDGDLPFDWIADQTRWMRKPTTHGSLAKCLERTAEAYRRSLWDDQDVYVEIWLEKDALAGVLYRETAKWDVPLMVTRGYPSLSYLHSAAESIAEEGKPAYLYYFGDHDPSGVDISRHTEERIRELAGDAEIHFERVAVNLEQIEDWDLPTRPTKKTDSRSKSFVGGSVEVDAIPPDELRSLARECIERHIDADKLAATKLIEAQERETLRSVAIAHSEDDDEDWPCAE